MTRPPGWLLAACALGLFLMWSNSFVAIGYLLGGERSGARLTWVELTGARFLLAAPVCAAWCLLRRPRESVRLLRAGWRRLLPAAVWAVPAYNFALNYGQSHGVPAPVASLTTALLPLLVLLLAAAFLGERLTRRRVAGFLVSATGMAIIATAPRETTGGGYGLLVLITALAPLSWSLYSVISKPAMERGDPLLWTYLAVTLGSLALLPLLPRTVAAWGSLDTAGWLALAYLSFPCTVVGFALWTWLLRHLPASSVGFTVFLNPPLTTLSKILLAALLPATFVFSVTGRELAGGALALAGLALAVMPRPRRARATGPTGQGGGAGRDQS